MKIHNLPPPHWTHPVLPPTLIYNLHPLQAMRYTYFHPLSLLFTPLSPTHHPPPPQPPTVPMVTDDNQLQEPGGGLNSGAVIGIASSLIILLIVISMTVFVSLTCNTIEVYLNDNNVYNNIICHRRHHSTMKL